MQQRFFIQYSVVAKCRELFHTPVCWVPCSSVLFVQIFDWERNCWSGGENGGSAEHPGRLRGPALQQVRAGLARARPSCTAGRSLWVAPVRAGSAGPARPARCAAFSGGRGDQYY